VPRGEKVKSRKVKEKEAGRAEQSSSEGATKIKYK
jgi:hypothetical protein